MNEKQLTIVKEYKIDKPLIHKVDSIIDKCYRDCHNNCVHKLKYRCIYNNSSTNIRNIEIIILSISDESLGLYDLINELKVAGPNGFIFNHINKLTIKNLSTSTIYKHKLLSKVSNTDTCNCMYFYTCTNRNIHTFSHTFTNKHNYNTYSYNCKYTLV